LFEYTSQSTEESVGTHLSRFVLIAHSARRLGSFGNFFMRKPFLAELEQPTAEHPGILVLKICKNDLTLNH
jgi:hypothetical protein